MWHIDGWDKLKPFGFCVRGAIDGYSRKILWLEVGNSNNNPRIIAKYYLDYVRQIGRTPRIIRADRGAENGHVCAIQRFFRTPGDAFEVEKSFMYGRSTANQRTEAWWRSMRYQSSDCWIRYFKDLETLVCFSMTILFIGSVSSFASGTYSKRSAQGCAVLEYTQDKTIFKCGNPSRSTRRHILCASVEQYP